MNVVVVFQSRLGSTERLALRAAVGAVQGRANIRLRQLAEEVDESEIAASPELAEHRVRMNREYVAPRPTDAEWADAIICGMPERFRSVSPEFARYFDSLAQIRSEGRLATRLGAVFSPGVALEEAMTRIGLTLVPLVSEADPIERARLQGRRVADTIRETRDQARSNLV